MLYGVSTPIRKNTFTKKGYKFAGWSLYIPGEDIWSYKNDAGDIKWCKEGQQPAGYKKNIYKDKQNVSQTVKSGKTVFFCANWTATDYFYVFFNHNTGGSGTMAMRQVKYGTETQMPKSTFTKSGRTFKGWQIYNSDTGMWLYKVPNSTDTAWYKEGEAPAGYVKRVYSNGTTIARTIYAGQHLVFLLSGMNLSSIMMPTVPMCIRVMLRRPHLLCMVVPIQCKNTKQMKHRKRERLKVIVSTESNWTNGVIRAKQTHHKPPGLRKAM